MTDPPPQPMDDRSSDQLAEGLAKIGLVLRHQAWESSGETGMTPTQAQIVALLAARPPEGLRITAIASELALRQPTVSDAVSTLVHKKLVVKQKAGDDARSVLVRLSPAGKRAAAKNSTWPDVLLRAIGTLDGGEKAVFQRVVVKIIHELQGSGQIPLGRMCTSCVHFRANAHGGGNGDRPHHCAYLNVPIGDADLRIDCPEQSPVAPELRPKLWELFVKGKPLDAAFADGGESHHRAALDGSA